MQRGMDQVSQYCDNYDLTISTKRQVVHQPAPGKLYSEDKNFKLMINSPTWEELSPEQCTLMMRSLPELQKSVWHLGDCANGWGKMESSLTPS